MSLALSIEELQFRWPKQSDFALHIPKWHLDSGQKVFLYGRSGEGKSTLLNLICGIESRYTGKIEVLGQNLAALSKSQRDNFRANNIGVIFKQFNLLACLSGEQNILLAEQFKTNKVDNPKQLLDEICQKLEFSSSLLKQKAIQLSVGQQQRVAVARALYTSPSLIYC
jgi:putative ABC transport system ATP-binding protein